MRKIRLVAPVAALACALLLGAFVGGCAKSPAAPGTAASDPVPSPVPVAGSVAETLSPTGTLANGTKILLLAWNDLGMHCYNADFADFAILPPYNNLHAQVVAMGGEHPKVITSGFTVEYSFPENTYSVDKPGAPDKSNFWKYVKQEFGVDLQPNVGLKGKGLTGTMDVSGNQFVAEGIPLTDVLDKDAGTTTIYPYMKARVVVKDPNGTEVAGLTVVAPVSTEMRCDTCHADDGDATKNLGIKPTGNLYKNILAAHDKRSAAAFKKLGLPLLSGSGPLLCASCHSDNALGAPGKAGISSLSNAMHNHHSGLMDITNDTEGCQNCHPGPNTKCLRDVHLQTLKYGCPDCHGDIKKVASNPNPWLNEPRCDNPACHKNVSAALIKQDKPLYRMSKGMGGLQCEACHDSTHALATSREANDQIKFIALQGDASNLHKCELCHGTKTVEGNAKVHVPDN